MKKTTKLLKPTYCASQFEYKEYISNGVIYVCDNLKDVVVSFVIEDAADNAEIALKALETVVKDYIESKRVR